MLDRRQSIAEAASHVFADLGYAQASITAIAKASGVTRPTVYTYFESKYEILRTVAEQMRDELLQAQENVTDDPEEILRTTTHANLTQWSRNFGVLTVIQHEALHDPAFVRLLDNINSRATRRHRRFIEKLTADGRAEPMLAPQEIVQLHLGATQRMAMLVWRDPKKLDVHADALYRSLKVLINLK
ncbi:TetR/AcrR family transcriptional regulator [Cumulibacter soli]|uniref:TetR/AcrR family transcriptional regulator n=1 Tax=Cumulibacter soli TaxID=2546344 RepID=UPI001068CB87|nr:TetR/AcrR family transcriptional regulator [Cumulibacter soli]